MKSGLPAHARAREGSESDRGPRGNDKFHGERAPKPHGKPRHDSEPAFDPRPAFKKKKRPRDNPAPQGAMANAPARPGFGNKAKKKNKHRG